jgi:hypothetical protein
VLTGRVVDERRRPVAGARVALTLPERPTIEVRSESVGRFRLPAGPTPRSWRNLVLRASDEQGRAGTQDVIFGPAGGDVRDVGAIVLRPGAALSVVTSLPRARVWLLFGEREAPLAEARTDDEGRHRFGQLPPGDYLARALSDGPLRGDARARLPRAGDEPLRIELGATRSVLVRVLEIGTGRPIPGARVEAWREFRFPRVVTSAGFEPPLEIAPTDERGETRIVGLLPEEAVAVRAQAEGFSADGQRGDVGLPRAAVEARIELRRVDTVTLPVIVKEAPVPPDRSVIALRRGPGSWADEVPAAGRMEGANLVIPAMPPGRGAIAMAPDGSLARLWSPPPGSQPRPIWFVQPRSLAVTVRDDDGAPVPGVSLFAWDQGNHPTGAFLVTDVNGVVRFTGLLPARISVLAGADPGTFLGGHRLGTADLTAGDGVLEATLPRERDLPIRVRLDGAPGLPAQYQLWIDQQVARVSSEDAETGELRVPWRPDGAVSLLKLSLRAPGFLPATVEIAQRAAAPRIVEMDLVTGGALVVRVELPADRWCGPRPERWDEAEARWQVVWTSQIGGYWPAGGDGLYRVDGLERGRYRVVDGASGQTSETVEVIPGAPPAEVRLDLARAGWVKGRVLAPEGTAMREVRVIQDGAAPVSDGSPLPGESVWQDGTFQIRYGGGPRVTLRPWHAVLAPAAVVPIDGPREGVTLQLLEGVRARLRPDPVPKLENYDPMRVLLFHGPPSVAPVSEHNPRLVDGVVEFGGFAPGTYTIWFYTATFAPVVLPDVELREGVTDLGRVALAAGSGIRLRILTREGQDCPAVFLTARALDGPAYTRRLNNDDARECVVRGLGPGRFQVEYHQLHSSVGRRQETILLDGQTEVLITMDLR